MTLYIIVPPVRLAAYRPLLRMWLSGLILLLTQRRHPPEERTSPAYEQTFGSARNPEIEGVAAHRYRYTLWSDSQKAPPR